MKSIRTKPMPCPYCGTLNDAASDPFGRATPQPGDTSMCIDCGEFSVFTDAMTLRALTAPEFAALPLDLQTKLVRMRLAQIAIVKRKPDASHH
jgi:hypothetical protein